MRLETRLTKAGFKGKAGPVKVVANQRGLVQGRQKLWNNVLTSGAKDINFA